MTTPETAESPAPAASPFCVAECEIAEWWPCIPCCLDVGHKYEHEANFTIIVAEVQAPAVLWWTDDGNAFVGSNNAVNTGRIA